MLKSGNDPKGTLQIQKYSRKSTKTQYEHQEYMAFKPQAIPPCPSPQIPTPLANYHSSKLTPPWDLTLFLILPLLH